MNEDDECKTALHQSVLGASILIGFFFLLVTCKLELVFTLNARNDFVFRLVLDKALLRQTVVLLAGFTHGVRVSATKWSENQPERQAWKRGSTPCCSVGTDRVSI